MPDDNPKLTRQAVVGYAVVGVGVLLVVLGLAWKHLVPDEVYWSAADAEEWTEASREVHDLISKPPARSGEVDDELHAAKQRLGKIEHDLERARIMQTRTGTVLSIAGAILAACGALVLRRTSS